MTKTPDPAVKAEANDTENLTVEWRDLKFEVPLDQADWPFTATLAFQDGNFNQGLRELLPPDQFAAFVATKPKNRDGAELVNAISEALGFADAGESPASSD